jgi:hypothetical protein
MPRADKLKNNFLLGELSPQVQGQVESEQYEGGVELLKNYHPLPTGGVIRRSGTKYVGQARTQLGENRLIPFIFSEDAAYVIEVAQGGNWRVFKDHAQVADPTSSNGGFLKPNFQHVQVGDTLFMASRGYPITLKRESDTLWTESTLRIESTFSNLTHFVGPFNESTVQDDGTFSAVTLTNTSALTNIGDTSTINASAAFFTDASWESRIIRIKNNVGFWGYVKLGTWSSTTSMTGCTLISAGTVAGEEDASAWSNIATTTARSTWQLSLTYWDRNDTVDPPWGEWNAIGFYLNRLVLAGSNIRPNRICLSRPGDFYMFADSDANGDVSSDHAIIIDLNDTQGNEISWVQGTPQGLLVGTHGGIWLIDGADDGLLAPGNSRARIISRRGNSPKKSTTLAQSNYMSIPGGGRGLIETGYNRPNGAFISRDLTRLSEHLYQFQVAQIEYQDTPHSRLWTTLLRDNPIAVTTYDDAYKEEMIAALYEEEGIFAPTRIVLGGTSNEGGDPPIIESMAVIPAPDGSRDEVWLMVQRYLNGQTVRTIEYFAPEFENDTDLEDGVFLDCAQTNNYYEYISDISRANPAIITFNTVTTGLSNGDRIKIEGVTGMTEVNGNIYELAGKAGNTFELIDVSDDLDLNSGSFGVFTKNNTAKARLLASSLTDTTFANETLSVAVDGVVKSDVTVGATGIATFDEGARVQVGFNYDSEIKLLRPNSGSATGTAMGKTQRTHRMSFIVDRTGAFKAGKSFDDLRDVIASGSSIFTGIKSVNTNFDYELGNRLCLRQNTPVPGTILGIIQHLATQDR